MAAVLIASLAQIASAQTPEAEGNPSGDSAHVLESLVNAAGTGQGAPIASFRMTPDITKTGSLLSLNARRSVSNERSDEGDGTDEQTPAAPPDAAPPPSDSIILANGRLRLGAVVYGDWAFYTQTGFGPQFVTQTNFPGPGNDNFNSFDIHRTYLNFFFMPTDRLTVRLTPNIFREAGGATAGKLGATGSMGSSIDGNLTFRIKYAYLEFGKVFDSSTAFKSTNIRFGSQMNPLIDWEEALYDYRFVNLVPWNYLSLSSTQLGVSMNGPISANGKTYLDYQIGVFNNTNFHQFEQSEQKQFMARGSLYPMGATSRFQGLGLTGFYDHGYTNSAPDTNAAAPVVRVAALAHYTTAKNGALIAAEYDYGKNAFGTGNLFSGSAPQDLFGLATTTYANMTKLSQAVLAGTNTGQSGWDVFGRANLPNTRFAVFGTYEFFQPNTNIPSDPFDFHRLIVGLAYRVSPRLRFAFDSQNLIYRHDQFTYPAASLAGFSPSLATANPGGIANAVPTGIKAAFVNIEFTF